MVAHATKLYGDFFFSTTRLYGNAHATELYGDYQTARGSNQPDDDGCCFFFCSRKPIILNIIIIHLLHSHIHCDIDHSCSKLPQHDLNFFPHGGKFSLLRGKFFPQHCWQHCSISNLPPEGRNSRDRGSGGGTFILVEIFTSPGLNPTTILLSCNHCCSGKA